MSATLLAAVIAVVAGYASSIYFIVSRIDTRLDRIDDHLGRIEERLTALEVTAARTDQRLADHLVDH